MFCFQCVACLPTNAGSVVVLAGHVTKSGEVAGPRVLEHMVDTGAALMCICVYVLVYVFYMCLYL
jgi:predicted ATP-dependent serine protease